MEAAQRLSTHMNIRRVHRRYKLSSVSIQTSVLLFVMA